MCRLDSHYFIGDYPFAPYVPTYRDHQEGIMQGTIMPDPLQNLLIKL